MPLSALKPVPPLRSAEASPARIVIIDDSAVVRGFLTRWIEDCADIEVVGTATDGIDGIAMVAAKRPDVVVLDIEMPRLDGLQALPEILAAVPDCKVLMSSRLTVPGARTCLQCLDQGAADVIAKPAFQKNLAALSEFRNELLAKIRGLAAPALQRRKPGYAPASVSATPALERNAGLPAALSAAVAPEILLIGASTGGPQAINEFLAHAKAFAGRLPIVIAQHMPGLFTTVFAEHLVRSTGHEAREAAHGELLKPGVIYVAPGGHHTSFAGRNGQTRLVVSDDAPIRFARPSIDRMLESGTAAYGAQAWSILLTGMGQDGLIGAQALKSAGGRVLVQDEKSSVVWGIPGAVARAGLADVVGAPKTLAAILTEKFAGHRP